MTKWAVTEGHHGHVERWAIAFTARLAVVGLDVGQILTCGERRAIQFCKMWICCVRRRYRRIHGDTSPRFLAGSLEPQA